MRKGFPIGFEMAEKNVNKQTDRHFRIYISRDRDKPVHLNLFSQPIDSKNVCADETL